MLLQKCLTLVTVSAFAFSCGKKKKDDDAAAPPKSVLMALSLASTTNQKKLAAGLTIADTLPASISIFALDETGTEATTATKTVKPDSKGNVNVSLPGATTYIVRGFDAAGVKTDHVDSLQVVNANKLSAVEAAKTRAARIEKNTNKVAALKAAVAQAKKTNDAKTTGKKTSAEVATSINPKTVAKATDAIAKQEKKDAKKNGKATDTALIAKKVAVAGKASAGAAEKSDTKKKTATKTKLEEKKKKAFALGLISAAEVTVTDDEVDAKMDEIEAFVDSQRTDPTLVAKYNTDDGVDDAKLDDAVTAALVASYPDDADLIKGETAAEDMASATKDLTAELSADEKPSDEDLLELRSGDVTAKAESIALASTTWDSMSATEKAAAIAVFEIALSNFTDAQLTTVTTAVTVDAITAADAAATPIVNVLYLLQTNATVAAVNAAVNALIAALPADDATEFADAKAEEAEDLADETSAAAEPAPTTTTEETATE